MTRRHAAGFTLIEVLIGATLLAILMTLLTSALFTMTRSAHAGETRLERNDSEQLAGAFLRHLLESTVPLTERVDGEEHVLFEGLPDRLRFIGHLPIVEGGGLQFLELAAVNGTLAMRYRDAWPEAPFAHADGKAQSRELVRNTRRVRWRYYGAPNDESPARWADEWRGHDRLPELIRVELEHGDESATTIVAAVRVRTAVAQAALYREPPRSAP